MSIERELERKLDTILSRVDVLTAGIMREREEKLQMRLDLIAARTEIARLQQVVVLCPKCLKIEAQDMENR